MKLLKGFVAAAVALASLGAQAAVTYTFADGATAGDWMAPSFSAGTNASVQTTSLENVYLRPEGLGDWDSFLVVSKGGSPETAGSATVDLGGVSSFSFVWGSPDYHNSIEIHTSAGIELFDGSDLSSLFGTGINGDNTDTGLFTISATDGASLDQIVFRSSGVAFELAVANPVPEPETYAMMLAGLAAMGFVARRRRAD